MNVSEYIKKERIKRAKEISDERARLHALQEEYELHYSDAELACSKVQKALRDIYHLDVVKMDASKSGERGVWMKDDKLRISMNAKPFDGKFKFFHFCGYDKDGKSKNYKKVSEKQQAMKDKLSIETGIEVHINRFSLELRPGETTKTVLLEFWV